MDQDQERSDDDESLNEVEKERGGSVHSDGADSDVDGEEDRVRDNGAQGDEEEDDDEDSDTETQRIGNSVLRFARRCVKSGEFAKAMAALMNIVEISDLASVPCRQALLFTSQIFSITDQTDKAVACLMEIWTQMPPPYTTVDAQLILAMLHEQLLQPQFAGYWYKKALKTFPFDVHSARFAWLRLARKSYDQGDFILAREAFSRAFACILQTQDWPEDGCPFFRFVAQFLTAVLSVAHLQPGRLVENQSIALTLALALDESQCLEETSLRERAWDADYLSLRRVYAASFPALYSYLFSIEDDFVGRISRAWRVYQARQVRRTAIDERDRERAAAATARAAAAKATTKKKKPKKKMVVKEPTREELDDELRALRRKTKARVQSIRVSSPRKRQSSTVAAAETMEEGETANSILSPDHRRRTRGISLSKETVASPTRRKLETVKRLRNTSLQLDELPSNQLPQGESTSTNGSPRTLLDIYAFPALANHRLQFEIDAGRSQGPADLEDDLEDIEAFARLAHYRSRVLVDKHQKLYSSSVVDADRILPEWLRRLNDVLQFIHSHHTQHKLPMAPVATAVSYFSEIHARVVFQLTKIHQKYLLQHGKTMFTIKLLKRIKQLEAWQFTSVEGDVLRGLEAVRAVGEQEEAHRNLEFYHVFHMKNEPA